MVNTFHAGHFHMLLLSFADFFKNELFSEMNFSFQKILSGTISVSNGLDSYLGPNCLQRLSADDKSRYKQGNN